MKTMTIHTTNGTKKIASERIMHNFVSQFLEVIHDNGTNIYKIDSIDEIEIVEGNEA